MKAALQEENSGSRASWKLLYRREIAEVEPGDSGFAGRRQQKISLVLMAFEKEDSRTRA